MKKGHKVRSGDSQMAKQVLYYGGFILAMLLLSGGFIYLLISSIKLIQIGEVWGSICMAVGAVGLTLLISARKTLFQWNRRYQSSLLKRGQAMLDIPYRRYFAGSLVSCGMGVRVHKNGLELKQADGVGFAAEWTSFRYAKIVIQDAVMLLLSAETIFVTTGEAPDARFTGLAVLACKDAVDAAQKFGGLSVDTSEVVTEEDTESQFVYTEGVNTTLVWQKVLSYGWVTLLAAVAVAAMLLLRCPAVVAVVIALAMWLPTTLYQARRFQTGQYDSYYVNGGGLLYAKGLRVTYVFFSTLQTVRIKGNMALFISEEPNDDGAKTRIETRFPITPSLMRAVRRIQDEVSYPFNIDEESPNAKD